MCLFWFRVRHQNGLYGCNYRDKFNNTKTDSMIIRITILEYV